MTWLTPLADGSTVTGSLMILAVVAAIGLALGSIRIQGVGLGVAGVLFGGLLAGHLGFKVDEKVLDFTREFGLVLFVYSIGTQVGAGFFSSLRREGVKLNLLAAGIVVMGTLIAAGLCFVFGLRPEVAAGLLAGATTNTPSLASAQQALIQVHGTSGGTFASIESSKLPGLGCAMAYPFGVLGIILSMYVVRVFFHINIKKEQELQTIAENSGTRPLKRMSVKVTNANFDGIAVGEIPLLDQQEIVVSRILSAGVVRIAGRLDRVKLGDVLLLVGPENAIEQARLVIGVASDVDLTQIPAGIAVRRVIVTKKDIVGKKLQELNVTSHLGVKITRVIRAEMELPAGDHLTLHYGDVLQAVGANESLDQLAEVFGNSEKQLRNSELIPIFVGLALGVLAGSCPIWIPGLPAPLKLGLAGGPLLVAIALGQVKKIGPLIWYMPIGANYVLRELGISLFLAAVGLHSGDQFWETLSQGDGVKWILMGSLITLLPLLLAGFVGRVFLKMNYLPLCGVFAGSMTTPALAAATALTGSESPNIAYAAVYPLTMTLRILMAQLLVLFMVH